MSYIEIKTINGRQYRYERVSTRQGKRVTHTSRYLGPVNAKTTRRLGAGRKPRLKVRDLTDEERVRLAQLLHSNKSFEKDRARILSLSSQGQRVRSITKRTGFHRPKVEKIIKAFNKDGMHSLQRKKNPGRPRRITAEQRATILQYLNTNPRTLGLHVTNWSLQRLAEYANAHGIAVSPSQVRRIIKADNIKYKRKTPWLFSNDPQFAKKNL